MLRVPHWRGLPTWGERAAIKGGALLAATAALMACGTPAPALPPEAERGRQRYAQLGMGCHGDAATGRGWLPAAANHGPQGHTWHHGDGQLIDIVLGKLDYPDRKMPSFAGMLTEQEVRDVIDYLRANWTSEQRAAQGTVTRNELEQKAMDG